MSSSDTSSATAPDSVKARVGAAQITKVSGRGNDEKRRGVKWDAGSGVSDENSLVRNFGVQSER